MGLRSPQAFRDIGQVLGLILAVVALVLGIGSVVPGTDKGERSYSSPFERQGSEGLEEP
jgi:hypothetical protein